MTPHIESESFLYDLTRYMKLPRLRKRKFNKWAFDDGNIYKLGPLSDFAAKYIMANSNILKNSWDDAGKTIISEFYKTVQLEAPEWINLIEKENVIEQSNEETYFGLRGFLEGAIIEGYRRDFKMDPNGAILSVEQRLDRCLEYRSIPYIFKHIPKKAAGNPYPAREIVITWNIIPELLKAKIPNISTLVGLAAEIPGFKYSNLKVGELKEQKKVVHGTLIDFLKFLSCDVEKEDKDISL